MTQPSEYPQSAGRKRHAFARLLLEITLVMVFVMIMTYSPGSHNSNKRLDIKSADNGKGGGAGLAHTTIRVTSQGFILNGGEMLDRETLTGRLETPGGTDLLLRIEPGDAMHENLRWLLAKAGESHEIELEL